MPALQAEPGGDSDELTVPRASATVLAKRTAMELTATQTQES